MATAAATTYQGTFHGRAGEVARVRREITAYLDQCPVADDLVLIADELPGPREPGGGAPRGRGARAPGGVTFTGAGQPGATYQTP